MPRRKLEDPRVETERASDGVEPSSDRESGSSILDIEKIKKEEAKNPSRITRLKESLKQIYLDPKKAAQQLGKKELEGVKRVSWSGGKLLAGSIGFSLLEIPKTLWKEIKMISKILWKASKGEKPPLFGEIWKNFFDKKGEDKK